MSAQQEWLHLNPVIDKLVHGKPFFGVSTTDLSIDNAQALSRADIDYVYVDMEHGPLDMSALRSFLLATIDKAAILKKGNAQPNVALFARFAPYGREQAYWVAKQALDMGLMGVIFNGVETKEQALHYVQMMRYPQPKGSRYMEPPGLRGHGAASALWLWGIPEDEYIQRADLWPLNPRGDLLAIMMIETAAGLKNVNDIAAVPGVGGIFVGRGSDLSMSLGVSLQRTSSETEAAFQTILKACLSHGVVCGKTVTESEIPARIKEGWTMFGVGNSSGGLTARAEAALRAAREALAKQVRSAESRPT
jgi:4-hydroxy-2-oxoheptanedioate aldolase